MKTSKTRLSVVNKSKQLSGSQRTQIASLIEPQFKAIYKKGRKRGMLTGMAIGVTLGMIYHLFVSAING